MKTLTGYLGNPALFHHGVFELCFIFVHNGLLHFRSCDSTFGLGASREDEFRWFSAPDNIGSTGELVNSDFKFPSPESNSAENLSSNHTFLKGHSSNDGAMVGAPIRLRDGSWISENPESHLSFVDGPAIANGEQGCNPKAHVSTHHNVLKPVSALLGLIFRNSDVEPLRNSCELFATLNRSYWGWQGVVVSSNSAEYTTSCGKCTLFVNVNC